MSRVEGLAENSIVTRLKTLKLAFDDLKATGQTMGSTSVVLRRVTSGLASDFHVSTTYNVINGWEVTFTPTTEGVANTGFLWHLFFSGINPVGTGSYVTFQEFVSNTGNVWKYRFWIIGTSSGSSIAFDMLIIIYAMTKGTISVSQIQ
jgi:hypothetical protein